MPSLVDQNGQITIEPEIREALGVRPGMEVIQVVVDGHLHVFFVPARHRRSLFGILPVREPVDAHALEQAREEAWDAVAAEHQNRLQDSMDGQ